jgi:phosphatidylserine/phosphatidylglycerophosphate/cardiolipin synthase-like enzyme
MKILLKSLLLLFFCVSAHAAKIEFVESVPVGTNLDSSYTLKTENVWVDMMMGAEHNIDLEMFYISNKKDEPLENVLYAMKDAAERGVKIRILAGKMMKKDTLASIEDFKGLKNIEIRFIDFKKVSGGGVQHTKFFIVDGKRVFMGSQNFDWRAIKHIHELGVKITSKRAAKTFQTVFDADWKMAKSDDKKSIKKIFAIKPNYKPVTKENPETAKVLERNEEYYLAFGPKKLLPKGFSVEINELLTLIKNAKKSISTQVMSYAITDYDKSRWKKLDKALRKAAKKGIKIKLIFADWTVKPKTEADIKSLSKVKNISIKISTIPQDKGGFVPYARVDHCKYMLVDNKISFISTSNWGKSYFYSTRSAAIIMKGKNSAKVLNDMFNMSWNSRYVKKLDINKEYKPVKKN